MIMNDESRTTIDAPGLSRPVLITSTTSVAAAAAAADDDDDEVLI